MSVEGVRLVEGVMSVEGVMVVEGVRGMLGSSASGEGELDPYDSQSILAH